MPWTKLKALWLKLIRQDATPNAIAMGFAIGFFSTFYPVPVVDTLVALAVARLVRANIASCLIGNNFILLIFPVIPVLIAAEVYAGRVLIHAPTLTPPGDTPLLTWLLHQTGANLTAYVLGGLVLGVPSALVSFWGVRKASMAWQKRTKDRP